MALAKVWGRNEMFALLSRQESLQKTLEFQPGKVWQWRDRGAVFGDGYFGTRTLVVVCGMERAARVCSETVVGGGWSGAGREWEETGKESEGRLLGCGEWCLGFPAKVTRKHRDRGNREVGKSYYSSGRTRVQFQTRRGYSVAIWLYGVGFMRNQAVE